MAVLKTVTSKAKEMGSKGVLGGTICGFITGIPLLLGIHPFVSYLLGGAVSYAVLQDDVEKKICLFESTREALIQLMSAE